MKRLIYSICIFVISISAMNAQNNTEAERVITSIIAQAKSKAIKTNFTLSVSEKKSINLQTTSGVITIKGNKFMLNMNDMKVWYDGKTQWAYVDQNNEVSITEPTEEEIASINPISILASFKSKSKTQFASSKSKNNYDILMTPKIQNGITSLEVISNKKTGNLISIKLINKNKSTTLLTVTNYQTGITASDEEFIFKKDKYKGVTINDLR